MPRSKIRSHFISFESESEILELVFGGIYVEVDHVGLFVFVGILVKETLKLYCS